MMSLEKHDRCWVISFFRNPWPSDMAEQCNGHRREGKQCLSRASLLDAGVGEPRRTPEGSWHGQTLHGASRRARPLLDPFAETNGPRLTGAKPRRILKYTISFRALATRYSFTLTPLTDKPTGTMFLYFNQ